MHIDDVIEQLKELRNKNCQVVIVLPTRSELERMHNSASRWHIDEVKQFGYLAELHFGDSPRW